MSNSIAELVALCRAQSVVLGQQSRALDQLAGAVLALLQRTGQQLGMPRHDVDDVAQASVTRVLDHLLKGDVQAGKEDAYVAQAMRFGRRGQSRAAASRLRSDLEGEGGMGALPDSGPSVEQRLQGAQLGAWLEEQLRDESIPQDHRRMVEEHCVNGVPLPVLIDQELARNPRPSVPRPEARKQAQNKVYQDLLRGRKALARRLEEREALPAAPRPAPVASSS